jgi:membrane-associated phospholipid phosphatase
MYLGVHYPSDVLAGVVIGTGTAALCFLAKKAIVKKNEQNSLSANELKG